MQEWEDLNPTKEGPQKSSVMSKRPMMLLLPGNFCFSLCLCTSVVSSLFFSQLRTRRTRIYLALLAVTLVPPLSAMGGPPNISLEQYVHAFESSYHAVNTLRANFTQSYTSGGANKG